MNKVRYAPNEAIKNISLSTSTGIETITIELELASSDSKDGKCSMECGADAVCDEQTPGRDGCDKDCNPIFYCGFGFPPGGYTCLRSPSNGYVKIVLKNCNIEDLAANIQNIVDNNITFKYNSFICGNEECSCKSGETLEKNGCVLTC